MKKQAGIWKVKQCIHGYGKCKKGCSGTYGGYAGDDCPYISEKYFKQAKFFTFIFLFIFIVFLVISFFTIFNE